MKLESLKDRIIGSSICQDTAGGPTLRGAVNSCHACHDQLLTNDFPQRFSHAVSWSSRSISDRLHS